MAMLGVILTWQGPVWGQLRTPVTDSASFLRKVNDVQIANYTPKNGKEGKDVDFVVELLSLGTLNRQGRNGKDGPDLKVMISLANIYHTPVLLVTIPNPYTLQADSFYVNPQKGQIKIIADGSNGGKGGRSSKGFEGDDGNAGKGGSIEMILDSAAAGFARYRCFIFSNKDGVGENNKEPQPKEVLLPDGHLWVPYNKPIKWTIGNAR